MSAKTQGFLATKYQTTANNVATPVVLLSLAASASFTGLLVVNARNTATGATGATIILFSANRPAANAVIVGTPQNVLTFANGSDPAMAAITAPLSVSGVDLRVNVTGLAGTNIEWMVMLFGVLN